MARTARVQRILEEAAELTPAERAELAEELAKPIVFTEEDMARQRKAILGFPAIPTVAGTDPNASSAKYAVLKHDIDFLRSPGSARPSPYAVSARAASARALSMTLTSSVAP